VRRTKGTLPGNDALRRAVCASNELSLYLLSLRAGGSVVRLDHDRPTAVGVPTSTLVLCVAVATVILVATEVDEKASYA
jgi:ABC-type Fe3+-siderophore transport system permease subunit